MHNRLFFIFFVVFVSVAFQLITHLVISCKLQAPPVISYFSCSMLNCIVVLNYVLVTCFINKWWLWKCLNIQVNQPLQHFLSFRVTLGVIKQQKLWPLSPLPLQHESITSAADGRVKIFMLQSAWLRLSGELEDPVNGKREMISGCARMVSGNSLFLTLAN